ncbi:DUF2239 family protein, partial [Pseudomonas aeruginosa]|nr:DUF2239 family protein [Pseudomonas aeruginosa]
MANDPYIQSFTCFDGTRRLLTAALPEVALALKQAVAGGAAGPLLVFDNATGRSVDLDIRGSSEDLLARLGAFKPGSRDNLSDHGQAMAELPAHPRIAHLLLRGQ